MEKGKAEVKNLYIAFPSYSYTFFVFLFITKMANFNHDIYITYRKIKHIILEHYFSHTKYILGNETFTFLLIKIYKYMYCKRPTHI